MRRAAVSLVLGWVLALVSVDPASAAVTPPAAIANPLDLIGDGLGAVKDVVLGGLTWSAETAGRFITTTLQGIADALIPDSWAAHGADPNESSQHA